MRNVDNTEDLIDTRDLIKIIEDFERDRDAHHEEIDERAEELEELEADEDADPDAIAEVRKQLNEAEAALAEWIEDEAEELKTLKDFAEQVEDYCTDFLHGETLIRESYFTEYAEELVKDCYGLPSDLPSFIVIDWEATAENVKQDYTSAEFDGVTYYFR
jgi:hypothetical protein